LKHSGSGLAVVLFTDPGAARAGLLRHGVGSSRPLSDGEL
jgi:hypothetical protein